VYLRGELIDRQVKSIQVVPKYNPALAESSDVLFITCGGVSRENFRTYHSIFSLLKLKVNYWDANLYRGISYDRMTNARHYPTWVNHYHNKLLLVRLDSTIRSLRDIAAPDLISHFSCDTASQENSSLLVMAPRFDNSALDMADYLLRGEDERYDEKYRVRSITQDEFSDEFRISYPDDSSMKEKCRDLERKAMEQDPSHRFRVKVDKKEVKRIGGSWLRMTWKYSYGEASLYEAPVSERERLYGVEVPHNEPSTIVPIFAFDSNHHLTFINTESMYFKLFFTIMSSLSIIKRLGMLNVNDDEKTEETQLIKEVVAETIYRELKREMKMEHEQCFGRLEYVISLFADNPELTMNEAVIYGILVILHRLEATSYWRSWVPEMGLVTALVGSMKTKRQQLIQYRKNLEKDLVVFGANLPLNVSNLVEQAGQYVLLRQKGAQSSPLSLDEKKESFIKHLLE
jgi:hypothetical protein